MLLSDVSGILKFCKVKYIYTNISFMLCNGWIILRETPQLNKAEPYLGDLNVFLLLAIMCISPFLSQILIYLSLFLTLLFSL